MKWIQIGNSWHVQGHFSCGAVVCSETNSAVYKVIKFFPTGNFCMGVEGVRRHVRSYPSLWAAKRKLQEHIERCTI